MYWKRVQDHLIHERVDGGRRSNSERERKHCRCRKRRTAEKGSCRGAQVVYKVPQPSSQPNVAHFLPDLCDAAEFQGSPPSGLRLRQTGQHQVIHATVEMVAQLAIQSALQLSTPKPVEQLLHCQSPSSKINWTAPVSLAQLSFSTASCFRPEAVKE